MKRFAMCYGIFLLAAIGCDNQSSVVLTDSSGSTTTLAEANSVQMLVPGLTKDNFKEFARENAGEGWDGLLAEFKDDGSEVVTFQKAVVWNGVSPVEDGVLYKFESLESIQKAYADRPEVVKKILVANGRSDYKAKESGTAALADPIPYYAHAFVLVQYPVIVECYGMTGSPSGQQMRVSHQHYSKKGNEGSHEFMNAIYNYDDSQQHNLSWAHYWNMDVRFFTFGWVTYNGYTMAYDEAIWEN